MQLVDQLVLIWMVLTRSELLTWIGFTLFCKSYCQVKRKQIASNNNNVKNKTNRGSDSEWMDQYLTTKAWMSFRGYCPKFSKFEPTPRNSYRRLIEEVLRVVKTKTIVKWELNTCNRFVILGAEDFFVGQRRSKIYTMWKFYHKYTQYNRIYTMNM